MSRAVQRNRVYESRIFDVEECRFQTSGGETVDRSVVRHPGAVLIVPVLEADHLVLIRNWRVAVEEALWEFPAGTLEPGEPPLTTATRELTEETGYQAETVRSLGTFYTSPGFADERMHVFEATGLTPGSQQLEAHEEIEVQPRPVEDVMKMVEEGLLVDGKSIAALHLWRARHAAKGGH
jgi:ADP-ribose pyrophosphatase